VYGTYLEEASVILGEDWDASNQSNGDNYQGPTIEGLTYQAFIGPEWINGPGILAPPKHSLLCNPDIYAGDNRTFNPALASFRIMQAISVGVGGETDITPANAPLLRRQGGPMSFPLRFSPVPILSRRLPTTTTT